MVRGQCLLSEGERLESQSRPKINNKKNLPACICSFWIWQTESYQRQNLQCHSFYFSSKIYSFWLFALTCFIIIPCLKIFLDVKVYNRVACYWFLVWYSAECWISADSSLTSLNKVTNCWLFETSQTWRPGLRQSIFCVQVQDLYWVRFQIHYWARVSASYEYSLLCLVYASPEVVLRSALEKKASESSQHSRFLREVGGN